MCNNKMRQPLTFIAFLFTLFSCGQSSVNKPQINSISQKTVLTKEVWTLYSKQKTIFHVKRLLSSDTGLILLSYDINTSEPEAASQTFISNKTLANEKEVVSVKSKASNFNWIPYKAPPTLFVQIDGRAFQNEMQELSIKQDIEQKIKIALKLKGLGEWTAGDIGPGGVNMLYEVSDIDNAISIILQVLKNEGLSKVITIGRRVNIEAEDWFYEVLYPTNFTGIFVTM